jgi:hypothetical protein
MPQAPFTPLHPFSCPSPSYTLLDLRQARETPGPPTFPTRVAPHVYAAFALTRNQMQASAADDALSNVALGPIALGGRIMIGQGRPNELTRRWAIALGERGQCKVRRKEPSLPSPFFHYHRCVDITFRYGPSRPRRAILFFLFARRRRFRYFQRISTPLGGTSRDGLPRAVHSL